MTPSEQKRDQIFGKLSPYGLTTTGASTLSSIEGILELIEAESLLPNPMQKPRTITPVNGKVDPRQIRGDYRMSAAAYLDFWIRAVHPGAKSIDHTHPWTIYQALRDYCETKVQSAT